MCHIFKKDDWCFENGGDGRGGRERRRSAISGSNSVVMNAEDNAGRGGWPDNGVYLGTLLAPDTR